MKELTTKDFKRIDMYVEDEVWRGESLTYWQSVKMSLLRNKVAIVTIIILLLMITMAIIYPVFTKVPYELEDYKIKNLKPSLEHLFGTDAVGREIFAGFWKGARTSFSLGFIVAFINLTIGLVYGSICSFYGGLIDDILMRVVEIMMNIPLLVIVVLMNLLLGRSLVTFVVAMSITGWCNVAQLIRGQLIQKKQQEYILAAKALGASSSRIISKHLIRNIISTAIVTITLEIPNVIMLECALSFIGFGSPLLSWGRLFFGAAFALHFYPSQVFIPAFFISLTIICFNVLGDALRDAFNPHEVTLIKR